MKEGTHDYVRSHLGVSSHQREGVVDVVVVRMGHQQPVSLVHALGDRVGALFLTPLLEQATFSCWK